MFFFQLFLCNFYKINKYFYFSSNFYLYFAYPTLHICKTLCLSATSYIDIVLFFLDSFVPFCPPITSFIIGLYLSTLAVAS